MIIQFTLKHRQQKVMDILRKTWSKMSDHGRRAALEYQYSDAPKALIEIADLVTEMKCIKHPYERGIKAQPGIDY